MMKLEIGKKYTKDAEKQLAKLHDRIDKLRQGQKDKKGGAAKPYSVRNADVDWDKVARELKTWATDVGGYLTQLREEMHEIELKDIGDRFDNARKSSEKRIAELRESGGKRWTELQATVETGLWDLRSALQRVSEGVDPILHLGEDPKKTRYFLQRMKDGRWALIRKGASSPTRLFDTKGEGVKASRRYVRDRRPSELVIRRRDGTFEDVHSYPA